MTKPNINRRKRYGLFALAVVLFLSGVVLLVGVNNLLIRSFSGLMFVISVYLFKISNVHDRAGVITVSGNEKYPEATIDRPSPVMWAVGIGALVVGGVSFLFLYRDALEGYQEIWPVYVFAGVGFVCALIWGYLIAKLIWRV